MKMTPPESVQRACKRGLDMYEEGLGGDGLEPATIKEARSMAQGEAVTEAKVRKAYRWWSRNERFLDEDPESPAMVSALLWGGASGRDWFRRLYNDLVSEEKAIKMNIETRQLREFNLRMEGAEESGAGLGGTALAYGQMDSYGTVFAPGSATGCIPDFVKNGSFLASHDADDLAIGYIRSATDTGAGLEVQVDYHSTQDAMDARTVAMERLKAGKKVGLSIGFQIANYVEAPDGDSLIELASDLGYDMALFNQEEIRKCKRECYLIVRLAKILEVSQVNFPAVPDSEAKSVRNSSNNLGSTPDGISLADQLEAILESVEAVTRRAEEVQALRSSAQKSIGKTTLEKVKELRDNLSSLISKAEEPTALQRQKEQFNRVKELLKK